MTTPDHMAENSSSQFDIHHASKTRPSVTLKQSTQDGTDGCVETVDCEWRYVLVVVHAKYDNDHTWV